MFEGGSKSPVAYWKSFVIYSKNGSIQCKSVFLGDSGSLRSDLKAGWSQSFNPMLSSAIKSPKHPPRENQQWLAPGKMQSLRFPLKLAMSFKSATVNLDQESEPKC